VRRFVFKPQWILGHILVVAAAFTCIRLADWQLARAHVTEALQNWGYALQWPLFSAFFLIGWWRMLRLESIRLDELEVEEAEEAQADQADPNGPAEAVRPGSRPADAEDQQLAAYNRMLAKLAAQDAARDEAGRR
jgi:DNA-binding transcriptional regulator of glucitol operon